PSTRLVFPAHGYRSCLYHACCDPLPSGPGRWAQGRITCHRNRCGLHRPCFRGPRQIQCRQTINIMDKPIDFKAVAAQLAKTEGEASIQSAAHMNVTNGDMARHAIDLMAYHPGAQVLEIGPGNLNFSAYVLSKGHGIWYTGVDRSE